MSKKRQTIALCGISHVSNFGCEAIIRSTYAMLKDCLPDCEVIYASRNAESDKRILGDLDLEIYQIARKPDLFSRAINKLSEKLHMRARISFDRYRRFCTDIDVILSVGGDIYTVDEKLMQRRGYRCNNRLVQLEEYARQKGCRLILYGASVGPFPRENGNEEYFKRHLNHMDLLVCREQETIRYLKDIAVTTPMMFSPDPAFFLQASAYNKPMSERHGIVVNLSGRVLIPNKSNESVISELGRIIVQLHERTDENIYLMPHVYSQNESDDDLTFLKNVFESIPKDKRGGVEIHEERDGFMAAKAFLMERCMLIAARMHCAINAMSEATPTLLLSYSKKSIGMAEYVYGSRQWVVGIEQMDEIVPAAEEMYKQREAIRKLLLDRMKEIRRSGARADVEKEIVRISNE